MSEKTRLFVLAMILVVGVVGGAATARYVEGNRANVPMELPRSAAELQDTFAAVADAAVKSVVHITMRSGGDFDVFGTPENVGSGVIVSAEGHILTNNHVVEGARQLHVRFVDGKEFEARVIGADPESDLALVKIDPPRDLKLVPAVLGDSDKMRVGDWVLAIGSPFGYNHTVTVGIVSAKHRRAQLNLPYQDFIQTDAAINPGNSGGALVNLKGEVIGVNTAIISESRSNEGVGLAIAVNLAKWVKDRLFKDGKVRRGFLGIAPYDFNRELVALLRDDGIGSVEELLEEVGLKSPEGVYVVRVEEDSPADRAGMRPRDVLMEFNGKRISGQSDMYFRVAEVEPGTEVTVKVLRDKKEREFQVTLGERPPRDLYGRTRRPK